MWLTDAIDSSNTRSTPPVQAFGNATTPTLGTEIGRLTVVDATA
jgi:hypothetical protein